ncbi:MAG: HAD family hydrolase [Anaerolineaceae bacterium]|nr:HAD family hydrolase [Anaerolineaceae bacterium]
MISHIEAIFLDIGNTIRILIKDPEFQEQATQQLYELVSPVEPRDVFFEKINVRWKNYRKLSKISLKEASERELWTKWLLPDQPEERIAPLAGKLTRLWRDHDGRRLPREDAKDTIVELAHRGYKLGIIANTITETEIPDWMDADDVRQHFQTVVLSSKVTLRKPDPEIFLLAAREIGVNPKDCAYVGDNPVRDVEGTYAAGFSKMILIEEPETLAKEDLSSAIKPDYTIQQLSELLDIFPPCNQKA